MSNGQWHVNPDTGIPGICTAQLKCPWGEANTHGLNPQEAIANFEKNYVKMVIPETIQKKLKEVKVLIETKYKDLTLRELNEQLKETDDAEMFQEGLNRNSVNVYKSMIRNLECPENVLTAANDALVNPKMKMELYYHPNYSINSMSPDELLQMAEYLQEEKNAPIYSSQDKGVRTKSTNTLETKVRLLENDEWSEDHVDKLSSVYNPSFAKSSFGLKMVDSMLKSKNVSKDYIFKNRDKFNTTAVIQSDKLDPSMIDSLDLSKYTGEKFSELSNPAMKDKLIYSGISNTIHTQAIANFSKDKSLSSSQVNDLYNYLKTSQSTPTYASTYNVSLAEKNLFSHPELSTAAREEIYAKNSSKPGYELGYRVMNAGGFEKTSAKFKPVLIANPPAYANSRANFYKTIQLDKDEVAKSGFLSTELVEILSSEHVPNRIITSGGYRRYTYDSNTGIFTNCT